MDFSRLLVAHPPSPMCVTLKPLLMLLSVGIGADPEDLSAIQGQWRAGVVERYDRHDAQRLVHLPMSCQPMGPPPATTVSCGSTCNGQACRARPRKKTTQDDPANPDSRLF